MLRNQFCGISNSNLATPDHVTIQGERAAEFVRDILEHLTVLFQAVRVKCRHDATPTEILYSTDDAPDHEIRSKAPTIMFKHGNGSIGRNQQRQYIEAIGRLIAN